MKYIVSGTDRAGSNSLKVSQLVQKIYSEQGEKVDIIDLAELGLANSGGPFYGKSTPPIHLQNLIDQVGQSDGLIMVVPEYNGSMPGVLKYFIDHWKYPESFEFRPVCFIGLGGMFGGLRPVEHLQQVFSYRNAFMYPERIFMMNVWKMLTPEGNLNDAVVLDLLHKQASGFSAFCKALRTARLDANGRKL